MKQKQKEKLVQLLSEMVGQAISLSVTEPNMKTEDFVKDWIANRNEDINAAFGSSRYSEQCLDDAAEKHLNYALFKLSYDDEDGIEQYILDAFEAGAEWQKTQMMKEAVEGYVNYYEDSGGILMAEAQVGCPYHTGDKVRIIIVKED